MKDKVITEKPAPKSSSRSVNPPRERQVSQQQTPGHLRMPSVLLLAYERVLPSSYR